MRLLSLRSPLRNDSVLVFQSNKALVTDWSPESSVQELALFATVLEYSIGSASIEGSLSKLLSTKTHQEHNMCHTT